MTPCQQLDMDLRFAEAKREESTPSIGRLILRILGIEEIYDWLSSRKDFSWRTVVDFLQLGEYALALYYIFGFLRTGAAIFPGLAKFLAKLGPWFFAIMIAIIVAEIGLWFYERMKAAREFEEKVLLLYTRTKCETKDAVFNARGIPVPRPN